MKRKAVQAELRKESETFEGWLKYEVTIQNTDGTFETVPAYGKDLQDALSRVVHDERVLKIERKTKRIPDLIWVVLWFGYISGWTLLTYEFTPNDSYRGFFLLAGLGIITSIVVGAKIWFRRRNISK